MTQKRSILIIYSELYYKKKIQPLVNAAMKEEPETLTQLELNTRQLRHYQRIRADCWVNESPEVREEVLKVYDAEHNGDDNEEENDDDENEDDEDEKSLLIRQQE